MQVCRWHAPPAVSCSAPRSPQSLFLLLSIVFFLLAGGMVNPHAHKVGSRWQAHSGCCRRHLTRAPAGGRGWQLAIWLQRLPSWHRRLPSNRPLPSNQPLPTAAAPRRVCLQAGGWLGLVVSGIAFYGAAAELLNEMYKKVGAPAAALYFFCRLPALLGWV